MIVWIYIILKIETLVNSLNLNLKINKYIKLKNKKLDRFLNYIFWIGIDGSHAKKNKNSCPMLVWTLSTLVVSL
jgi:hypothetical protein